MGKNFLTGLGMALAGGAEGIGRGMVDNAQSEMKKESEIIRQKNDMEKAEFLNRVSRENQEYAYNNFGGKNVQDAQIAASIASQQASEAQATEVPRNSARQDREMTSNEEWRKTQTANDARRSAEANARETRRDANDIARDTKRDESERRQYAALALKSATDSIKELQTEMKDFSTTPERRASLEKELDKVRSDKGRYEQLVSQIGLPTQQGRARTPTAPFDEASLQLKSAKSAGAPAKPAGAAVLNDASRAAAAAQKMSDAELFELRDNNDKFAIAEIARRLQLKRSTGKVNEFLKPRVGQVPHESSYFDFPV